MTDPSAPNEHARDDTPVTRRDAQLRRARSAHDTGGFNAQMRAARTEFDSQLAHARAEFEEANARIKQRTGRDLFVAIAIGLAIGLVVIASLVFLKWIFLVFALAACALGVFEFTRALQHTGRRVDLIPQLIGTALMLVTGYFAGQWMHWISVFIAIAFVIVWRLMAQMIAADGRTYGSVVMDVMVGGFTQLYVPFLASLAMILLAQEGGEWWVMAFLIIAVVADTGAYVTGLTLGRHRMAPRISPNKTWEGFAGAAVFAMAAGVLIAIFMLGIPWWAGLIFGAVLLGTATAGDLGESMVKRDLGIKDMSSWLPGHGGVLDRLDSILPSATAALALFYLLSPLGVA